MSYPKVSVKVTNGNLLRSIAVEDSVGALVATVSTQSLVGVAKQVYSLVDAESKGYTAEEEPFVHDLIKEFYNELGGNQRLFIFGTPETMTMTDALSATTANGVIKLLNAGGGDINLVAIARKPSESYDAGKDFLDSDVPAAVTACKSLCEAQQTANTPIRIFIEGRVADASVDNTYKPSEAENGFAAIVLGGTKADGSAAVSVALARACKYGAHVKLGSGQNGALSVQQIYIGNQTMEERLDMETLHDAGFLTFQHRPGAAGYYFGRDNMCSSDDYAILVHGRIIDKAQRLAAAAYLPYIEDSVRVNSDGTLDDGDTAYLENVLESALLNYMSGQISDVEVVIDTDQDIINTSTLQVGCRVLPLGYSTWIIVTLGLASQLSE